MRRLFSLKCNSGNVFSSEQLINVEMVGNTNDFAEWFARTLKASSVNNFFSFIWDKWASGEGSDKHYLSITMLRKHLCVKVDIHSLNIYFAADYVCWRTPVSELSVLFCFWNILSSQTRILVFWITMLISKVICRYDPTLINKCIAVEGIGS